MDEVLDSVTQHEGFREKPYIDPLVMREIPHTEKVIILKWFDRLKITFGYGMTFITEEQARMCTAMMLYDIRHELARRKSFFTSMPIKAQDIFVEMAYQMGIEDLMDFKNTWRYAELGQWENAANEMLDSKWAREQTPDRAKQLSDKLAALGEDNA
ncbi:glycoside hydrolase family protein [Hydrogenovibrio marinus]|uniref:Uncharacterized protein n=1 Tax=Hydrogenovibrio marinus TaxID=28885 RepID=A0A066ZM01_HYDMR|nr:glycoside hydrolase family protein [Hydrogenovibrio marinus]KDN94838.1 hypothetical protein EI16_00545 [Hydrogenovibrio marinus]BBN59297.1 hypothetical protein HVMH_0891 [Hydrogenovibrio marinus]